MASQEEIASTLKDVQSTVNAMSERVVRMETYQKTHWESLKNHEKKIGEAASDENLSEIEERVRKVETRLSGIGTVFGIGYAVLIAWIGDIFKRGS